MPPRHWLHPQTVPRGFLRLYILTQLAQGPRSGYDVIQTIEEKTEGAWRPGPGTVYPLLKSLEREGLIGAVGTGRGRRRGASRAYSLTRKGRKRLDEVAKMIAGAGRKEAVMGRLLADLLPADVFVQMMVRRFREGGEAFRQKLAEIPQAERTRLLQELRLVFASQLDWVDSQLASLPKSV